MVPLADSLFSFTESKQMIFYNFSQNISNKLFHTCDKFRNSWDFSHVQQWESLWLPSTGFQLSTGRKDLHISSASGFATLASSKIHIKNFLFYNWVPINFFLDLLFISHLDHPVSLPPKHKHPHKKSFWPKVMALVFCTSDITQVKSVFANRKAIQRIHLNFLKTATCQKDKITANQSSSIEPKLKSSILDKRKPTNFKLNHHILSLVPTNAYLWGPFAYLDELSVKFLWWDTFKIKIKSMNHQV